MKNLTLGLRMNPTIDVLSLNNCGLTERSAIHLLEMLIFKDSKIKELSLEGNELTWRGAAMVFKALKLNRFLAVLNLADNKIDECEEFIDAFMEFVKMEQNMKHSTTRADKDVKNPVENLNISKNNIGMQTCNRLAQTLISLDSHSFQSIVLPDKVDKDINNRIQEFMQKGNKGRKKKKGKG